MISVDDDMMMGTEVRTGFEVVQLPLSAQRACALRRIIIAEKAGNNPTHTASQPPVAQQRIAERAEVVGRL